MAACVCQFASFLLCVSVLGYAVRQPMRSVVLCMKREVHNVIVHTAWLYLGWCLVHKLPALPVPPTPQVYPPRSVAHMHINCSSRGPQHTCLLPPVAVVLGILLWWCLRRRRQKTGNPHHLSACLSLLVLAPAAAAVAAAAAAPAAVSMCLVHLLWPSGLAAAETASAMPAAAAAIQQMLSQPKLLNCCKARHFPCLWTHTLYRVRI
jgi:hypothetical protein